MIEKHLDYLQFSAMFMEGIIIEKKWQVVPALKFYKRGYADEFGLRYYFGNPNSKKALVVASADSLHRLRSRNRLDAEILQWAFQSGAEFTRIDLAVTEWVGDTLLTLDNVKNWNRWGLIESILMDGGAKSIEKHEIGGVITPETFYVGDMKKRGKLGIFRAYDKGIELDLGKYLGTRLEIEMRGEVANNTALRIAETNDIAGNFRARFNVLAADFERIMDADAVKVHRGKGKEKTEMAEKIDGRWQWLMKQVAPALKEAHDYDRAEGKKSNRFYWFLRESGLSHAQIMKMVAEFAELGNNGD